MLENYICLSIISLVNELIQFCKIFGLGLHYSLRSIIFMLKTQRYDEYERFNIFKRIESRKKLHIFEQQFAIKKIFRLLGNHFLKHSLKRTSDCFFTSSPDCSILPLGSTKLTNACVSTTVLFILSERYTIFEIFSFMAKVFGGLNIKRDS